MSTANFHLRVNGIHISRLRVRRQMQDGFPSDRLELVVTDPVIGQFAINDDDFVIETRDLSLPTEERAWVPASVSQILITLCAAGLVRD